MSGLVPDGPRKHLRVGHVSERGAVNAVRTLFEAHGMVVVEVDGRSDYGRDLIVDITEGSEITGAVIGVQVKGDRSFIRATGDWQLPCSPRDRRFWADSTVPVVGVLWDPDSGRMRWANLTEYARTDPALSSWAGHDPAPATTTDAVALPAERELTDDSIDTLVDELRRYLRQSAAPALLGLFDDDDDARRQAIFDCWTLGRKDSRAFTLLRRALPDMTGESLRDALIVLSHLTPHPDVIWHQANWIPPQIKQAVTPRFRWSAAELRHLVHGIESLDDGPGWERGGVGQCLWMLLIQDPALSAVTLPAIGLALARGDLNTAVRLLVIHQYCADDALAAARDAVQQFPGLREHRFVDELIDQIATHGHLDVL